MISKQEYGQLLRQQIKERQDAKKAQKRQFTPQQQNMPTQVNSPYQPPPAPKTPIVSSDQIKSSRERQKQLFAKKMEQIEYNPFGKGGGGAPVKQNKGVENRRHSVSNPQNAQNIPNQRKGSFDRGNKGEYQQNYGQEMGGYNMPYQGDPYKMNPGAVNQMGQNPAAMNMQYKRIPTPQFLQGAYNNQPFISADFAPPAPYGYVVEENDIGYMGKINLPPQPRLPYEPTLDPAPKQSIPYPQPQIPPEPLHHQQILENYNNRKTDVQSPTNENANNLNEQDMFKKGGRNLLRFENQAPEELMTEQNKKLKLQQDLKIQMEEAARKKKEDERKRKEADELLQKKNLQFLAEEKRKYEEELKGKKNQAKNIAQDNAHLQKGTEPPNPKKEKYQKIREAAAAAKRQQEQRRQTPVIQKKVQQETKIFESPKIQRHNDLDEVGSVISSDTQLSRGFNTAISKQFFKKEKQKGKIQKFSEQMEKMRKQIANQGNHHHDEIAKLQREADRAKRQKQQADNEIGRLKKELRVKMDDQNKKYLEEIYSGKVKINDPFYADEVGLEQQDNRTLKPKSNEKLVLEKYEPPQAQRNFNEPSEYANNSEMMMSLNGDSKKIPLDLTAKDALSISKLGDFAKDSDYFSMKRNLGSPVKEKYHARESIEEEDERIEDSRGSGRTKPKEELDKLLKSRSKSRGGWGQLSSVNDDMVVEIEKMMMQNKSRPKSHLSSMGERTLYTKQNEQLAKIRNEQYNLKRKIDLRSNDKDDDDGQMNSLDKLIQKYM